MMPKVSRMPWLILMILVSQGFFVAQVQAQAWEARHGLASDVYQGEFTALKIKGYRPLWVSGYSLGERARFAALWEKSAGPAWVARHNLSSERYQATFDELNEQGYRPICVSGYGVADKACYAALWEKRGGPAWEARHGLTGEQYQATFDELNEQGYRPVCVSGYSVGGKARYAAIWEKRGGPAWEARHGLTGKQYQATFDDLTERGYRPTWVSGYEVNGEAHFAAIWEKSAGPAWVARHGLTSAGYQATFDELNEQGYRPVCVGGYSIDGEDRYVALWEKRE